MEETSEGRKYLEYHEKFNGKPFGLMIGMLDIFEMHGSITALYDECIKRDMPWEELLGWDSTTSEDIMI